MIEIHMLRYVLAAADTGSFSQAADLFGIKQATLSKSVLYLEDCLGLSLFTRSTRGVAPTGPGRSFLDRARCILDDVDGLVSDARALGRGERGTLRIGFHGSLAQGDLAAAFAAFRNLHPAIHIDAREQNRDALLRALERGRIDVAVTAGESTDPAVRSLRLWSEPLVLAMAADHPLAASERLYWTDLRNAEFLVTADDPGPDIGAMIASRLSAPGHDPVITRQRVSRENLLSFAGGNRIAIGTGMAVRPGCEGLVLRRVHDAFGASSLEQRLHWRHDNEVAPLGHFLSLVTKRYGRSLDD
jgi:DNA-binding transcriptional LysR family regulator